MQIKRFSPQHTRRETRREAEREWGLDTSAANYRFNLIEVKASCELHNEKWQMQLVYRSDPLAGHLGFRVKSMSVPGVMARIKVNNK